MNTEPAEMIEVERDGMILSITLNRPKKRNALRDYTDQRITGPMR